ncbi:hypothetical protein ABT072_45285 [Streptomyces sp. NPDC002589]
MNPPTNYPATPAAARHPDELPLWHGLPAQPAFPAEEAPAEEGGVW